MKEIFEELAEKIGAEYQYQENRFFSVGMSTAIVSVHILKVPYKDCEIVLEYEFGNHNMAKVHSTFDVKDLTLEFELKKVGHVKRLFTRSNSLIVTSKKSTDKVIIERLLLDSKLEGFARNTVFEPSMKQIQHQGKMTFEAHYFLGFHHKEKSMEAIIAFFKGLIDEYKF